MKPAEKFEFTKQFQDKLLALLFKDPILLGSCIDYVKPTHFDDIERRTLARWLFDYFKKFQDVPTLDALEELCRTSDLKEGVAEDALEYFTGKISLIKNLKDEEFLKTSLLKWVRTQALISALLQSKALIEGGEDPEAIVEVLQKSFNAGIDIDIGRFYFEGLENRIERRARAATGKSTEFKVPTLIKALDIRIDGGLRAGEIGVIVAGPKVGKTMGLIHMAKAAIVRGYYVVFYSFEIYPERLEARFDATFSGIKTKELLDSPEAVRKRVREMRNLAGGDLLIQYQNAGEMTVGMLDAHLKRLRVEKDFQPDLICIDYADLLKPTRHRKDEWVELKDIYTEIRNLARTHDAPLWTASQVNRSGYEDDFLDITKIAGAWSKVGIADLVVTFQRDKEAVGSNILTGYIGANRNDETGHIFRFNTDFSRATFYTEKRQGDD